MDPLELRLPSVGFFGLVVVNREFIELCETPPIDWFFEW